MTLRDALAAALHSAHVAADGECRFTASGFGYPWEGEHCRWEAKVGLSDPAFRAALVEAVAEAMDSLYEERWGKQSTRAITTFQQQTAAEIVAEMLGEEEA